MGRAWRTMEPLTVLTVLPLLLIGVTLATPAPGTVHLVGGLPPVQSGLPSDQGGKVFLASPGLSRPRPPPGPSKPRMSGPWLSRPSFPANFAPSYPATPADRQHSFPSTSGSLTLVPATPPGSSPGVGVRRPYSLPSYPTYSSYPAYSSYPSYTSYRPHNNPSSSVGCRSSIISSLRPSCGQSWPAASSSSRCGGCGK